jgi:phosphoglucosamine mutase
MSEQQTPDAATAPRLFGTDGIRAVAGTGPLSDENVARVAVALVRFARERTCTPDPVRVLLGRDPRPSGEGLTALLAGHMQAAGARVVDAGVLPSPALAWLTAVEGYDLGCSISASHNAPEYNGIKPFVGAGRKLATAEERVIEAALTASDPAAGPAAPDFDEGAAARYVDATAAWLGRGGRLEGLRLVVDLSAGAATRTAPAVLEALGADVVLLHDAGSRPINERCGSEYPQACREAVRAEDASAGLAFDGDADRVLVVDERGEVLDGDDLLAVLAHDLHGREGVPAGAVVGTVMANLGLEEFLAPLGVRLERTPVGDRHVAERMRALGSELGGEPAGHIVRPRADAGVRTALIGDGLVAGVEVLQAARRGGEPLSAWRAKRPRHPQLLVNVRMADRRPLDAWPAFERELAAQERALEGVGRLVVRYSGTEPLLRIMAEGRDSAAVERAVEALAEIARREA